MSFWTEIRPRSSVDHSTNPRAPRLQNTFQHVLRRLVVQLPAIVALICALLGLVAVADRHSAIPTQPTVDQQPAPTSIRLTLIDFNTATSAELATLPGIGPSRAEAIVQLRQQDHFRSLADLVDRGILRPSELTAIADLVAVYVPID